jgi:transposase
LPRYHDIPDPVARRKAVVDLSLENWGITSIAGYLETSQSHVYDTLRRWVEEGLPGLADRPRGPHHPARRADKAMAAIRRLQLDDAWCWRRGDSRICERYSWGKLRTMPSGQDHA